MQLQWRDINLFTFSEIRVHVVLTEILIEDPLQNFNYKLNLRQTVYHLLGHETVFVI